MENHTTTEVPVTVHWQDAAPVGSPLGGLFPILLMFGIFYFVLQPTSDDTGGLIKSDWNTEEEEKLHALAGLPSTDVAAVVAKGA